MKKPKLKKLPKRPKQSASLAAWENWSERLKDTIEENKRKMKPYTSLKERIKTILKTAKTATKKKVKTT